MRNNFNNSIPVLRYRSRGKIGMDVYCISRSKGTVQYHMGQDNTLGCAEESQGGIYTTTAKQFDQRYSAAR